MPSHEKQQHREILDLVFSSKSPLNDVLEAFEERTGQREMAEQILEAYDEDQIALIEAGTGTGKSLAYLVPAVFWGLKAQEKTVISTHTIALQEQLILKDIPFLLRSLDLDLKAVLVKGMSNYLCLRKLRDLGEQPQLFSEERAEEIEMVERWSEHAVEGSRSEIKFPLSPSIWENVSAEADSCTHVHCPHYKSCFFFKARRKAQDAQILVVNHHLLLADLIAKNKNSGDDKSILPKFNRLILDEAHHLEEIAYESLSKRMDSIGLVQLLGKLFSEHTPQKSRLGNLRLTLAKFYTDHAQIGLIQKLEIDLPAKKREAVEISKRAFEKLETFCETLFADGRPREFREQTYRLQPSSPIWESDIKKAFLELSTSLSGLALAINALSMDFEAIKDPLLQEKFQSDLSEVRGISSRLEEIAENLNRFFLEEEDKSVRWIERKSFADRFHFALVQANLDISSYLREKLFGPVSTVAMCSATLAVKTDFSFIKDRLGIHFESNDRKITEKIYDSPFDYQKQTLLLVPTDIPDPSHRDFTSSASKSIFQAITASKGNAFVLFTSYEMLRACYNQVSQLAEGKGFKFLKQGDISRQTLLEKFKAIDKSVLFGTDSFWEGVDVAGEALRCVIIVKLPFKVPGHPKAEAYAELLVKMGKHPFLDDSLPQAVIKFKQGFGRLIRTKQDRGCVVCLDKRLVTKGYGKTILKSLPPCRTLFEDSDKVFKTMTEFYKQKWSVAGSNR